MSARYPVSAAAAPSNTTVTPAKGSTLHPSHDTGMPIATSTPTAASVMLSTTSTIVDTSSLAGTTLFVQVKAKQPGECEVFVGVPESKGSEAKHRRVIKWVSLVRITRCSVRWAMKSKHRNSCCEAEVLDVNEDDAVDVDVLDIELKHAAKLENKQPTKVLDEMTLTAGMMKGKTNKLSL